MRAVQPQTDETSSKANPTSLQSWLQRSPGSVISLHDLIKVIQIDTIDDRLEVVKEATYMQCVRPLE